MPEDLVRKLARFLFISAVGALSAGQPSASAQSSNPAGATKNDWAYYGHDAGGTRYSSLTQINRVNVAKLIVAWTFHTGDISDGSGRPTRSGLETTPILVDGTLYLTSA
jgi:quinoprotein glucose dehydrogenase